MAISSYPRVGYSQEWTSLRSLAEVSDDATCKTAEPRVVQAHQGVVVVDSIPRLGL